MHSSIALIQSETCVQSVVIIGGGAFACEAMRSAVWNGAASVTLLTREKNKWHTHHFFSFLHSMLSKSTGRH